jgi:hypothetical protein
MIQRIAPRGLLAYNGSMFRLPRPVQAEKRTIAAMVGVYCRDHHGPAPDALCEPCQALLDYSHERLDRCPYGDDKPTCKVCPVHCYAKPRQTDMRRVMQYAGPRMLWRHPLLTLLHRWTEWRRPSPERPAPKPRRPAEAGRHEEA